MNDADFPVAKVIEGIEAAAAAGLAPVKINMVVKRGVNDHDIVAMARALARHAATSCASSSTWTSARTNGWRMDDVVPSAEIVRRIIDALAARAGRCQLPRRSRRALALRRRRGRDRRHLVGDAGVLLELHAHAPFDRGQALHLPLRAVRARPEIAACAAARATTSIRNEIAAVWQRARRPLLRDPHRRDRAANAKSRCPTSVAKHRPQLTNAAQARDVRGRGLQRARRDGADRDRRRASAHALRRQARDRHADDARPRARGAGHRLPAQPAPGRLDRRHRRGAGRLGNRFGRGHHAQAARISSAARQAHRHHAAAARARCSAT